MRAAARAAAWVASAVLAGGAAAAGGYDWRLPPGVRPPPAPSDNPMSASKVELGRRLFYDADLSVDGTLACASCHEQRHAFADSVAARPGVHGEPGRRNAPSLANVGYLPVLTWADPTQRTLEQQVSTPVTGRRPVEMGMHGQEAEIARRLGADACYRRQFADAFPETGGRVDLPAVTRALAAFQRTIVSWNSPYDLAKRGGPPLPEPARLGARVFASTCAGCHAGPQFTDGRFHILQPPTSTTTDMGAAEITGRTRDRGAFRTAPLRNVALTPPYLHDGSAPTVAAALDAHGVPKLRPSERADILAFLGALSDPILPTQQTLALPRHLCGLARSH